MKRQLRPLVTTISLCSGLALLYACGGSSNDLFSDGGGGNGADSLYTGKTTQATVTTQGTKETLAGVADIVPSCTATGVTAKVVGKGLFTVFNTTDFILNATGAKKTSKAVALIPPRTTPPAPTAGECGGTLSYPVYSHLAGTTTLSIKWDNYCTEDSSGDRQIVDGTLSAVDNGTSSPSGPVTSRLTAEIPKITVTDTTNGITNKKTIAVSGFVYTPASGATADISNLPGSFSANSIIINDDTNHTSTMVKDLSVTTTKSGTDTNVQISATGYKGTAGYTTIKTDSTLVVDSSQNLKSGSISFTGASNTKTVLTVVPGSGQKFNVSVNGSALTGTQLICDGL